MPQIRFSNMHEQIETGVGGWRCFWQEDYAPGWDLCSPDTLSYTDTDTSAMQWEGDGEGPLQVPGEQIDALMQPN